MKSQNKKKPRKIDSSDISSPENAKLIRKVRKILRQRVLEEKLSRSLLETESKGHWKPRLKQEGAFERIVPGKITQGRFRLIFCKVQARLQRLTC